MAPKKAAGKKGGGNGGSRNDEKDDGAWAVGASSASTTSSSAAADKKKLAIRCAELVNAAVKHQEQAEFPQARVLLEQALQLSPDHPDALFNYAALILEEMEEGVEGVDGTAANTIVVDVAKVHESMRILERIIAQDTSGRGEVAGMAHRSIAKTLLEYHTELTCETLTAQDIITKADDHITKARVILSNAQDLDCIILEHANFKKIQMSMYLSSIPPPASNARTGTDSPSEVVTTIIRSNAILNKALDYLQAVSRTIEEAQQTQYSSDIDIDCYRLHSETLDEWWDFFLLARNIEHFEKTMTNAEVERVSRIALDYSSRVALALTELTSDTDGEFLAHRGDLYQAILRWHRSLRVRCATTATAVPLSTTSSSSCGSSNIESLCSSLLRARLEAVLARNFSTARGLVDLADSLAFIVSEGVYIKELLDAFVPPADGSVVGGSSSSSSSGGGSSSSGGSGGGSSSSGGRKKEMMQTPHGCIQVALQLVNTMSMSANSLLAAVTAGKGGTQPQPALPPPVGVGAQPDEVVLSLATTPSPATLLLKIAKRCYEGAISLWRNGRMTREEYVDFDFDVAYYNLACVCWRLDDDAGCQAALMVCLYLEIASEFEDKEEARAYTHQVGLAAAAARFGPVPVAPGGPPIMIPPAPPPGSSTGTGGRVNELSALMSLVLQIRGGPATAAAASAPGGAYAPHSSPKIGDVASSSGDDAGLEVVPSLGLPPVPVSMHTSRLYNDVRSDSELAGIEHKAWFRAMFSQ